MLKSRHTKVNLFFIKVGTFRGRLFKAFGLRRNVVKREMREMFGRRIQKLCVTKFETKSEDFCFLKAYTPWQSHLKGHHVMNTCNCYLSICVVNGCTWPGGRFAWRLLFFPDNRFFWFGNNRSRSRFAIPTPKEYSNIQKRISFRYCSKN